MSAGGRPPLRKIGFCHIEHKGHKVRGQLSAQGRESCYAAELPPQVRSESGAWP